MQMEHERVGQWDKPQDPGLWPGGLTLGLQVAEQRLGVVQGTRGQATHAVLSQTAGGAQQRVPVLGGAVSIGDCGACGPDQGQGRHTLHHVLQEGVVSEGSQVEPGGGAQPHAREPTHPLWAGTRGR